MSHAFELGPIRPPSEAYSLLVRITRNCPWNKCAFCSTYRGQTFSRRSVDEIKGDIDAMRAIADRIQDAVQNSGTHGRITEEVLASARGQDDTPEYYYRQIAFWLYHGIKTAFLQDANSLLLPARELVEILGYLREKFPSIERITTYARAKTISKKTLEELVQLKDAGLSRLHIGMESGSDTVLGLVSKGVTAEEHIMAGQKAMSAGFDLSEYYMPGLGGREFTHENAIRTAEVVTAINPTFIRIRSTVPLPGTELHAMMTEKSWTPLTEDEKVRELRLFIENLGDLTGALLSDHMMNLLEDVEGRFPDGKQQMLDIIDGYLSMSDEDRENFIIGRRIGEFRYLADYRRDSRIDAIRRELKQEYGTVDNAVLELLKNFI